MPERNKLKWDFFFFFTPAEKKENQKIESYCPDRYPERCYLKGTLFWNRKELPTNTATSKVRLCTAFDSRERTIYKVPVGPRD